MVELEKLASLGGLEAGIAHDVNTVTATCFLKDRVNKLKSAYDDKKLTGNTMPSFFV